MKNIFIYKKYTFLSAENPDAQTITFLIAVTKTGFEPSGIGSSFIKQQSIHLGPTTLLKN